MKTTELIVIFNNSMFAATGLFLSTLLFRTTCLKKHTFAWLWASIFVSFALAAIFWRTIHRFIQYSENLATPSTWEIMFCFTGFITLLALLRGIVISFPYPLRQWLFIITVLNFFVYALWMTIQVSFRIAIFNYVSGILLILIIQIGVARSRREQSIEWVIANMLASFCVVKIQKRKNTFQNVIGYNNLNYLSKFTGINNQNTYHLRNINNMR